MKKILFTLVTFISMALTSISAHAVKHEDCFNTEHIEKLIQACTNYIDNGRRNRKQLLPHVYAFRAYGHAVTRAFDEALADADDALKLNKKTSTAYMARAMVYYARLDLDKALAELDKALIDKSFPFVKVLVYSIKGKIFADKGLYFRAKLSFDKAIKSGKKGEGSYWFRGLYYLDSYQYKKALVDLSKELKSNPDTTDLLIGKALAYTNLGQLDKALEEVQSAVLMSNPNFDDTNEKSKSYALRSMIHYLKGDIPAAWDDMEVAIENATRKGTPAHIYRSVFYINEKHYDRALEDLNWTIENWQSRECECLLKEALVLRAHAYIEQGQYELALKDLDRVLELRVLYAEALSMRGYAYARMEHFDRALADLKRSRELNDLDPAVHIYSAYAKEKMGDTEGAKSDYSLGLDLTSASVSNIAAIRFGKRRLAILNGEKPVEDRNEIARREVEEDNQSKLLKPGSQDHGHRIALVIGNSRYEHAKQLFTPVNDARAMAQSLRRLGFAEVIEKYDLKQDDLRQTLKSFGDKALTADWAVVYFAGYGIQQKGTNYLLPVDARLLRPSHIPDESVSLSQVLSKVADAKKLRLVILDANRGNPYKSRMFVTGNQARALGRGLAPIEPDAGTLVAFAAKGGQLAIEGASRNSPYTKALLKHIEESSLEINLLFRKVRDTVLNETGKQQEPFTYGSLPGEKLYFKF